MLSRIRQGLVDRAKIDGYKKNKILDLLRRAGSHIRFYSLTASWSLRTCTLAQQAVNRLHHSTVSGSVPLRTIFCAILLIL